MFQTYCGQMGRGEHYTIKIGYDNYDFTWTKNIPERLAIGDITISNICMDKEGHIIDFYGGADSLKNQEIKVLNPDFKFRKRSYTYF